MYIIDHILKNTSDNRRPALLMAAETITIHNTGNLTSTARNERSWLSNPKNDRQASFHIVIDEKEAIECLPLNEVAWHAGDGNFNGNMKSIGIEICESGNYEKTLDNAVKLVAKMLKARGWKVDKLRRHFDWSGKICPRKMYDSGTWEGWKKFVENVDKELNSVASPWAVDAQKWVIDKGLSDGTDPKGSVSREQMWVMLQRLSKI